MGVMFRTGDLFFSCFKTGMTVVLISPGPELGVRWVWALYQFADLRDMIDFTRSAFVTIECYFPHLCLSHEVRFKLKYSEVWRSEVRATLARYLQTERALVLVLDRT